MLTESISHIREPAFELDPVFILLRNKKNPPIYIGFEN